MTPESQTTKTDDLGPHSNDTYDFDDIVAKFESLGYATWRPTAPSRQVDMLARHPDGTIVRIHRKKRLIIEFDHSNCDGFGGDATAAKRVIEIRRSKNWRLAFWLRANRYWANCRWTIYRYFRVVGNIRYTVKQNRLRYKNPSRIVRLNPIYTEPPTSEFEWRGWGL